MNYAALLETYSFEEILELNDVTSEEVLEHLVNQGYLELPEVQPLEFDDE